MLKNYLKRPQEAILRRGKKRGGNSRTKIKQLLRFGTNFDTPGESKNVVNP